MTSREEITCDWCGEVSKLNGLPKEWHQSAEVSFKWHDPGSYEHKESFKQGHICANCIVETREKLKKIFPK